MESPPQSPVSLCRTGGFPYSEGKDLMAIIQCPKCLALEPEGNKDCGVCGSPYPKKTGYNCPKCRYYNLQGLSCARCGHEPTGADEENYSGANHGPTKKPRTGNPITCYSTYSGEDAREGTTESLEDVALLTEWIVGYREWRVKENGLYGEYETAYRWKPGCNRADGFRVDEGGFYAYHELDGLFMASGVVTTHGYDKSWTIPGVIRAKGTVYVYEDGFRAEYAEVVALGFSDEWKFRDVVKFRKWAKREYHCQTVEQYDLEKTAKLYGTTVPASVIPEWMDDEQP